MTERRRTEGAAGWSRFIPRREIVILAAFVAIIAFFGGYGLTAIAFGSATAPTDVVLVPDVRELSVTEAARAMTENGLNLIVGDSLPNQAVPAGAILTQAPLPGQEVSPGTEVEVIISTGELRPVVPEVTGMSLSMATRALEAAGFVILIEEAPGEGQPGAVLTVDPPAGTPLSLPDTILVRVGARPPFVLMPNLLGLQEDAARSELEALGLGVADILYENSETVSPYQVIEQVPAPGDSIAPGDPVRLHVTLPTIIRN